MKILAVFSWSDIQYVSNTDVCKCCSSIKAVLVFVQLKNKEQLIFCYLLELAKVQFENTSSVIMAKHPVLQNIQHRAHNLKHIFLLFLLVFELYY